MAGLPASTARWGRGLQLEGVLCPARGAEPLERMPRLGFGSIDTATLGVGAHVLELWVGAGVSAAAEGGRGSGCSSGVAVAIAEPGGLSACCGLGTMRSAHVPLSGLSP